MWQLKQTLKHNLDFTIAGEIELCILAYNDDAVIPYLIEYYAKYITDGRLKVKAHQDDYKPLDGSGFACGYAKNFAHAMSTGEVLFNLDSDNFIDEALQRALLTLRQDELIHSITGKFDGSLGRIGVHRTVFDAVGGYRDVGRADDGDFITRCFKRGTQLRHVKCLLEPLPNQ